MDDDTDQRQRLRDKCVHNAWMEAVEWGSAAAAVSRFQFASAIVNLKLKATKRCMLSRPYCVIIAAIVNRFDTGRQCACLHST